MSNLQVDHHIALLKSRSWRVRFNAAEALGEIGEACAVSALIETLNDKDTHVRVCAFKALGKIGKAAIPALLEALKEDSNVRLRAIEVLGEIGGACAVSALIETLNDKDVDVCLSVVKALGKIGTTAVSALLETLQDQDKESGLRLYAAEALGQIGEVAAVPALLEALKEKNYLVRARAAEALGQIGDAVAIPALLEALKAKENGVRFPAVEALKEIDVVVAVAALLEMLKDDSESVRYQAASALGEIGDIIAVPALIEMLKEENSDVRESAARALKETGSAFTLPRKILAASQFSAQERLDILDRLRHVEYVSKIGHRFHYSFPDTRVLCQKVLKEKDMAAREGAQTILDWLDGNGMLLRASQPDTTTEAKELLQAWAGETPETQPETLLIAASAPTEDAATPKRRTLLQRLFG